MDSIMCPCGREILLVPDLPAMNRAIENHVNEHAKLARKRGVTEANVQVEKIQVRLDLAQKTLLTTGFSICVNRVLLT